MNNNEIFDELVKAQQEKYRIEETLIDAIETWFADHDIQVTARILDYNYIRIWSTDEKMCNFDMNDFCKEFNAEINFYRHGWQWMKHSFSDEVPVSLYWMFELHQV